MGNRNAAALYWFYLLGDSVDSFGLGFDSIVPRHEHAFEDELGSTMDNAFVRRLDGFCIDLNISRFTAFLCAFSLVMEKYGDTSDFYVTHNYGVTGSVHRILKFPVTRLQLCPADNPVSFQELCVAQNNLIQTSSYHLCIPSLPKVDEMDVDRTLGVFLIDPSSGHTRESINDALNACQVSLIMELVGQTDIMVRLYFRKPIVPYETARLIYDQILFALSTGIAKCDDNDVRCIPTVPPCQEDELLNQSVFQGGAETVQFPELDKSIHDLILRQAGKTPERVAVQQFSKNHRSLTYLELVHDASRLAERIRRNFHLPATSDECGKIGLLLNRGINQVIAVLAVLMSGCAYVPMDSENHPPERIDFILRDSGAVGMISESAVTSARCFTSKIPVLLMDELDKTATPGSEETTDSGSPPRNQSSEAIAYVIYTSGSTGNPKGVLVPHRGVVNDVFCLFKKFLRSDFSILENVLFSTNLCFDAHVDELFMPLIFGGTITCLNDSSIAQADLDDLAPLTFLQSTPSVLQVITVPDSVKCVLIGGEQLNRACLERLIRQGRIILNGYGPTETTNESSLHVVRNSGDYKSIGKPIWNTQFYLLDRAGMNLVPKHAWGELYIGGLGVTKGYQNLPDLTSKAFFPNHSVCGGSTVYRTGDIVRINSAGELEFKGRKDSCGQIKLRGYRMELGEIQYAILSNNKNTVREAHVMVLKNQLVAFVTPETVRAASLSYGQLPEYMKPASVVGLKIFPRTVSGKLDVKSLSTMTASRPAWTGGEKPWNRSCVAQGVISDLCETLALEQENTVCMETNFFSIGGNSLNLIVFRQKLVDRFRVPQLKLQLLLQLQTVGRISSCIESILGIGKEDFEKKKKPDPIIVPLSEEKKHSRDIMVPFFCVHAAGGQVHTYSILASKLTDKNNHIAFYALQDPSLTLGSSHRLNSFEALGALYAKRINEFYPSGPVFLGGHSSGGLVAFETARSLEQDFARNISCVFLIDSECPSKDLANGTTDPQVNLIEKVNELRHYLYNGWKEGLMHDYIQAMTVMSKNDSVSNVSKTWQWIKAVLPRKVSSTMWSSDLFEMVSLLSHHLQIEKKYCPLYGKKSTFPLVLFRPSQGDNLLDQSANFLGWSDTTLGRVALVDVPGANHYSVVRNPAADLVANEISKTIDACVQEQRATVRN